MSYVIHSLKGATAVFAGAELLLLLFFLVPLTLVVVVVGVVLATSVRPDAGLGWEVAAARRHAVTTGVLALVLAVTTPFVALAVFGASYVLRAGIGLPFRPMACAPLAGALVGLVVLLVGELTWPRPTGASQTALLRDRSVRTLLDTGWARASAAAAAVTALGLLVGGLVGDGQTVTRVQPHRSTSAGPFPGWGFAAPQLVALALCVGLAMACVAATSRRSAVVHADAETDELLRRASVARVARLVLSSALVTLGADLFFGGLAAQNAYAGSGWHALAAAATLAGPLVLVLGLVALALPAPRMPAVQLPVGTPGSPASSLSA
jgi:hypothetical protein